MNGGQPIVYSGEPVKLLTDAVIAAAGSENLKVAVLGRGAVMSVTVTNGATPPTAAATIQAQVSHDGTKWFPWGAEVGGPTTLNASVTTNVDFPAGLPNVGVVITGGDDQGITASAHLNEK